MIYILTAAIETGKSNSLLKWVAGKKDIYGVLSPRNNKNKRYFLDINKNESFAMECESGDKNCISVGRYLFLKTAFVKANSIIEKAVSSKNEGFIIIDEIGKLELASEGLFPSSKLAILKTMHDKKFHALLVIRTSLLEAVKKKYGIVNEIIIEATTPLEVQLKRM